ncbi:MAG: hypothetical protein ACREN5_13160, partial [Gemmatimonadales bacterium]
MRNLAPTLGAALLVSLPQALAGQDLQAICSELGKVTVGQWASHRVTGPDSGTTRFAVVGTERQGNTTLYWFEMKLEKAGGKEGPMIMQMLVSGLGSGQAGETRAMVMKAGDQPAMRMPEQMIGMMRARIGANNVAAESAKRCQGGQVVGWEAVTVPAGTIRALHVKGEDGDTWVANGIPFGVVKA